MRTGDDSTNYEAGNCAAFMRSRDQHGDLSNMTGGFHLTVNGLEFQGSEGLYQALKYPLDPAHQYRIAEQSSGMEAKRAAYENRDLRPDWDKIKIDAMAYTLAVKLAQHPERFGRALRKTNGRAIVEKSYRDGFWGARPSRDGTTLSGCNVLGKLLSELRNLLEKHDGDVAATLSEHLKDVETDQLSINGRRVTDPGLEPEKKESMVDFDFSKIPNMENRTCTGCGQDFRGSGELCTECGFYQSHPEEAPGYWTWSRSGTEWKIRAKWLEKESWPEPGTVVTVHRKNGSDSQETILEDGESRYDRAGNMILTCRTK